MKQINLESIEKYDPAKFFRVEVFKGERLRTLLLTLTPGQSVPAHRHEGFEILLEPLRGEAEIVLDGESVTLRAGELILVDGANDFAPVNHGSVNFAMLITLVGPLTGN